MGGGEGLGCVVDLGLRGGEGEVDHLSFAVEITEASRLFALGRTRRFCIICSYLAGNPSLHMVTDGVCVAC